MGLRGWVGVRTSRSKAAKVVGGNNLFFNVPDSKAFGAGILIYEGNKSCLATFVDASSFSIFTKK